MCIRERTKGLSQTLILYFLSTLLLCNEIHSAVPVCSQHQEEIKQIRETASESLYEAHRLTGDIIGSFVVSAKDLAWNAVKSSSSYSEFSTTFQGAISHCNGKGKFLASNRLYKGYNDVGNLFLALYSNCILNHHNYHSVFERGKIYFERGDLDACLADMKDLLDAGLADDLLSGVKPADLLITKAQACLESGEYENAIEALSDVIKKDPKNKEAYFHRAAAYFETGCFDEALKDYLLSDRGKGVLKSTSTPPKDFTDGLIIGLCQGVTEAATEFVPSLCSSAYGLGEAIWAVHPLNPRCLESIKPFAGASYEIVECIGEYCKNIDWNTVEGCVDQVKVLYERFDSLNTSEKGELIGSIIGNYGVDIFAGSTVIKGVATYRKLQTANRLCNLETMAASSVKKDRIVAESLKHASEREAYFKNIKLEVDKQNKHIRGKHNFDSSKSVFEHNDPQLLLRKYSGKGTPYRGNFGEAGYQEIVNFEEFIGYHVCDCTGTITPTTWGKIHYSKNGAHIVPARPKK